MRVIGIDPGLERIGWGVIDKVGSQFKPVDYGLIKTPKGDVTHRLVQIHADLKKIISNKEKGLLLASFLLGLAALLFASAIFNALRVACIFLMVL